MMNKKTIISMTTVLYLIPFLTTILSPDTDNAEFITLFSWIFAMIPPIVLPFYYGLNAVILVTLITLMVTFGATFMDHLDGKIPLFHSVINIGLTIIHFGIGLIIHFLSKQIKTKQDELERTNEVLEESKESYKTLIELSPDMIFVYTDIILVINQAGLNFLNEPLDQVIGRPLWDFFSEESLGEISDSLRNKPDLFSREINFINKKELNIISKTGESSVLEIFSTPITFEGQAARMAIVRNITEQKAAENKITYMAYHDALTGLKNRDYMTNAIKKNIENNESFAVLYIDVDRFKSINDTLGHSVGDLVIKRLAKRLVDCVRTIDLVGRLGGDEFVICLNDISPNEVEPFCQKIIESITPPLTIEGQPFYMTVSIGVSIYPLNGTDVATLLKCADFAMYEAKGTGRNTYQFYNRISSKYEEAFFLEMDLRHAIEKEEFELYYQPIISIQTNQIIAAEALIRWRHKSLGNVSPEKFIPLAEETGLINRIGEWVLQTACTQNKEWLEMGYGPLIVCVNLSVKQLLQENFISIVKKILNKTNLQPHYLKLEITETMAMENEELCILKLEELKQIGVKIALDDFGTGYSSLTHLKNFPIDFVKIDKSFVRDITTDRNDAALVHAIIGVARSFDLQVVAEGVETKEQLEMLTEYNCDEAQGFYLYKPMPSKELENIFHIHDKD